MPFQKKVWLSTPTMHGEEQKWVDEAIRTNWVSTVGENINEVERLAAEKIGRRNAVGLATGTASLHLAVKLAGEKLYGQPKVGHGALERAFELYPEVRLIVIAHLYGTPGKIKEIREIADAHGALIVEDAAESFGATYRGIQTGNFGDVGVLSFNGNKIITGSAGGILLCDSQEDANKIRKWSTQSREDAAWYQHEEMGYNYRMSNIIAGIIRGQFPYLEEHIAQKKAVYERYREGLADLPVDMNPYDEVCSEPNFWLSCMLIRPEAMCRQVRGDKDALYVSEPGRSCPTEILEMLSRNNAEGRPIWKPMHLQPIYRMNAFVTRNGNGRARSNAYIRETGFRGVGDDIFSRGLCLPSDNKMTAEQQNGVIELIHRCFE